MQQAILETIRSARCEGVSNAELFRIRQFTDMRNGNEIAINASGIPLEPGDFDGLVNMQELRIYSEPTLKANSLAGLKVESPTVWAKRYKEGAFNGIEATHLRIVRKVPPGRTLPKDLHSLDIDDLEGKVVLGPDFLEGLVELEWLEIYGGESLVIHKDKLKEAPNLRGIDVGSGTVTTGRTLLAGLEHLEDMEFRHLQVAGI